MPRDSIGRARLSLGAATGLLVGELSVNVLDSLGESVELLHWMDFNLADRSGMAGGSTSYSSMIKILDPIFPIFFLPTVMKGWRNFVRPAIMLGMMGFMWFILSRMEERITDKIDDLESSVDGIRREVSSLEQPIDMR